VSTATATPAKFCDPAEVARAVRLIVPAGDVVEVRILDARANPADDWPKTLAGYFNDAGKLTAEVSQVRCAVGAYFTLNEVDPALLARSANRLAKAPKGSGTSDSNIIRRRWLLIDCDPERPAGISSADAEHEAAIERAQDVELYLHDRGWPDPIRADSGNGCHLLYRIDVPTDDGGLVQRCLEALAREFSDDAIKIDTGVYNPARICKLYGTLACKGDDTPDRPHRLSRIIEAPESPQIVPLALLTELAGPSPSKPNPEHNGHTSRNGQAFDLAAFIARNGFDVTDPHPWKGGGTIWEFRTSPMCDHGGDGPYIGQQPNGAIVASCPHNSCGWTWADLRERFEPRKEWKHDGGDRWRYTDADAPEAEPSTKRKITYQRITSMELAGGKYETAYLIDNTLAERQPLIIAGPQKTLKTSFIIDAAVTLAAGGCFLGKLRASRQCRVAVMTGESGLGAIQETARRVCIAAGKHLCDLDNLFWTPDLPKFGSPDHLEALEDFLTADAIEVLFIDPAYLAMPGADAGNLMLQGELLRGVAELCQRLGVTLVLAHHTKKTTGRDPFDVPELSDIAWSGFAEFARQWWLLGRREKYEPGTGSHRLWLSVGGSAGHSALWAVDVEEGLRTDPDGRRWDVSVSNPSDARSDADKRKADAKARRHAEQVEADAKAIVEAVAMQPDRTATKTVVKQTTGLNTPRLDAALASLLKGRDLISVTMTKGNNRTYEAFKLGGDHAA